MKLVIYDNYHISINDYQTKVVVEQDIVWVVQGSSVGSDLIQWNEETQTSEIKIDGTFVPANIPTGTYIAEEDILHGDLIYVSGVAGVSGKIKCSKFINDGSIESKYYVGVAINDTLTGEIGLFYSGIGAIRGIDTSSYEEGDVLYPSETIAGGYQTELPTNAIIPFGIVLVKNSINGVIAVRWQPESVKESSETTKGIANFPMMREAMAGATEITSLQTGDLALILRSGVLYKASKDLFGGGGGTITEDYFTFGVPQMLIGASTTVNWIVHSPTSNVIAFNYNSGISDYTLLATNSNSAIMQVPVDCKIEELYWIDNAVAVSKEICFYKSDPPNISVSFFNPVFVMITSPITTAISLKNIDSNTIEAGKFLHMYLKTGYSGTGGYGRFFIRFKKV